MAAKKKVRNVKPAKAKGTAIAKFNAQEVIQADAKPLTIMEIISRAAFDRSVDAEKIERLINMARQLRADDAKTAYNRDLVIMKPKLPVIDRNGAIVIYKKDLPKTEENLVQSTPYALWEDIDAAITPILFEHGFVLTFRTGNLPDGKVKVTGVLSHQLGHSEESEMALPLDTSGSKNNVQAAGSSTSYGKRYTASALLNIRTKGQDDNGVAGDAPRTINESQVEHVFALIQRVGADKDKFVQFMGVESVPDIMASDYEKAIKSLNMKLTAKAKEPVQ